MTRPKQTPERAAARKQLVSLIEQPLSMLDGLHAVKLSKSQRLLLETDASGDSVDAVLCMLVAAWAHRQHLAGHYRELRPACADGFAGRLDCRRAVQSKQDE